MKRYIKNKGKAGARFVARERYLCDLHREYDRFNNLDESFDYKRISKNIMRKRKG